MNGALSIVLARTPAECAPVRSLAVAHARHERSVVSVPAGWARRTSDLVVAGELDLFVARRDGRAIGYATLTRGVSTWTAERYGHLDCLFVEGGHRGTGTGALLVEAVADRARRSGLRELQWQTPSWNDGAVRFYDRLGARRQSKERFSLAL